MEDETIKLFWVDGTTKISHEQHIDGNEIVFGARINGGPFRETSRLAFRNERDLTIAKAALPNLVRAPTS